MPNIQDKITFMYTGSSTIMFTEGRKYEGQVIDIDDGRRPVEIVVVSNTRDKITIVGADLLSFKPVMQE